MKAAYYSSYGSPEVLQIKDVLKPEPGPNELLIKISHSAVNSGDIRLRKADPFAVRFMLGLINPKIHVLGSVFSGYVEKTGSEVESFKQGDLVFGHTDLKFGAYAEYLCISENATVCKKPSNLSSPEAAVIPFGALTAYHFLSKVKLIEGQKVLVTGAAGSVGSSFVQLAAHAGLEVTGICSPKNKEIALKAGVSYIYDYKSKNLMNELHSYDLVIDTVNMFSFKDIKRLANKNASVILSAADFSKIITEALYFAGSGIKVITGMCKHNKENLSYLSDLIEKGNYRAILDKTFKLGEISEAHRYAEKGYKRGNIAIEM